MLDCIYTTVQNISGGPLAFGFLGKHGRVLASNEVYSEPGDLATKCAAVKRKFDALERALTTHLITILRTPATVVTDSVTLGPKILTSASGTLGTAGPCW